MKPGLTLVLGVVALAAAIAAGYGLGRASGKSDVTAPTPTDSSAASTQKPKLLYYRNPMGLADTSSVPKKDSMGMDYIPVYDSDAPDTGSSASQVKITADKVQKLGVRTEKAQLRTLERTLSAAGRVEADERRIAMVAPKFEGYVERLLVNVTGQPVAKGQALFDVYSPELVSLQREYAIAAQGVVSLKGADSPAQQGMQRLVDSALQRLKNWDISEDQMKKLVASGETQRSVTFRSPVGGIVTEKKAIQGMRFMPGEVLYQISDLSSVWVIADVAEQDIGAVKNGSKATIRLSTYPDKTFTGTVTYVYPSLNAETRTVPVRVELANPGLLLKPSMFAQVEIATPQAARALTVPASAVIDSGTRQVVLVELGQGRFEPREVQVGERSANYWAITSGLREGESVVVAANFLIDAESNLKAAIGGFGATSNPAAALGDIAQAATKTIASVSHRADGKVDSVDAKELTVTLTHGPVASLKWPAMTMDFKVANTALLQQLQPGHKVHVEFVERGQGEWVITSVKK
jgi:RND family efflux transporter MFP subunit